MPVERDYGPASLIDVIDRILDKGLVIDAFVRISVIGLELITIEARVVVASVETYLRYAEAIGRIPMAAKPPMPQERQQLFGQNDGQGGAQGLLSGITGGLTGNNGQQQEQPQALPAGQGQGGNGQAGGLAGQLQGVVDTLNPEQGGGYLQNGVRDQLRAIIEQLQSNGQPAPARG